MKSLRSILRWREFPVLFALIVLVAVTYMANHRFLTAQSIKDLELNATILMILAAGQAVIIITRNVDLSVGSIVGISGFLTGTLFAKYSNIPIPVVFLAAILVGGVLGAFNGLLVSVARVPALVITLGTLYIYRGINNWWAGGKQYFSGDHPKAFTDLSVDTVLGFPIITLLAVVVIAVLAVYLSYKRGGRDFYAVGSNPDAARLFGIPVARRILLAFILNGLLAGLAGALYASRFSSVGATTGTGLELDVVAAAVVGGVAIFGGSGSVVGAAIGALLLTTITSSLTAVRIDKFWQEAVIGLLILTAIIIDRVAQVRTERKLRLSEAT